MLKIDFFPQDIISDYESEISPLVKARNGNKNEITFIPDSVLNPKTGQPYTIPIHDLLTLDREQILQIDGIGLYMYICSAQKYKSMSNVKLLYTLHEEYPDQVNKISHKNGYYKYEINNVTYTGTRKDDKKANPIIKEAAMIIRNKFAGYNGVYSNKYFNNKPVNDINELKNILDAMFDELERNLVGCTKKKNGISEPIIEYSLISSDLRHRLMNSIGLRTCPYCNRNYITRYGINGSKSTADLDHFYQKEQYPLFALSLFNFVPSCSVCNSRMKNIHPSDDTMYPYEEGFGDDVHFELKYIGENQTGENILHLWQALSNVKYSDFEIKIAIDPHTDSDKIKRIEKSKELFHIEEVYEDHKQDALETALRTRIYCEGSYKKFCEKLFDKCQNSGMIHSSAEDLEHYMFRKGFDNEWLMFGTFMNEQKRKYDKPLSRMIYDIYNSRK